MNLDLFAEPQDLPDEAGPGIRQAALISPCGDYRYWLTREWDSRMEKMGFIMLNPSTADAEADDPTIQRCMAFARRDGFGGIVVMNLFALRSSSPVALKAAVDPVGPDNDRYLIDFLTTGESHHRVIVAAWGANCTLVGERHGFVRDQAALRRRGLYCLGRTQDGHPKHPLARGRHRIPDNQPLGPWS